MDKLKGYLVSAAGKLSSAWQWYKSLYKGTPWYKKTLVAILSFILSIILFLGAVDINFLWLFGKSPGFGEISKPATREASIIYSCEGAEIGKFFNENRTPVKYSDITPRVVRALIDTEDERFYDHHGIDIQALFAAAKDAALGHSRGASTITQQLAKNLFRVRTQYSTGLIGKIPGLKILVMKAKEWIVAIKLEMCFSKEEIITMYFNTVDFGSNAYGIKTACKTYFGPESTPENLTYEQAATLVGLLKATSYYSPRLHYDNSKMRRAVVLDNMQAKGDVKIDGQKATKAQLDSIKQIDLSISTGEIDTPDEGKCQYFREAVKKYLNADAKFKQWCDDNDVDLYTAGLKIYTTIDTTMQRYAEEAAREQMKVVQQNFLNHIRAYKAPWMDERHEPIPNFVEDLAKKTDAYKHLAERYPNNPDSIDYFLNKPHKVKLFSYNGTITEEMSTMDSIRYMLKFMHCGFVAMEPQTGHVKAWVGDIDFKTWKYDKVTSQRQPGSTFKLFVYTTALKGSAQMGAMNPSSMSYDGPITMKVKDHGEEKIWAPHNANAGYYNDSISLMEAFARSINTVAVRLAVNAPEFNLHGAGIENVIQTAKDMGIKSPLDNAPSLSLGSSDVNLLELVNSYCTAVNAGRQHDPVLVTKITDREGNVIYEGPSEEHQAISERVAYLMCRLLEAGLGPYGTSSSMGSWVGKYVNTGSAQKTFFGGKTGTSSNHSDAWYVAVSPKLVGGAWVGGEYRCIHFQTGALGQGSRTALPIVGKFFGKVLDDAKYASKYLGGKGEPFTMDDKPSQAAWAYTARHQAEYYNDTIWADTIIDGIEQRVVREVVKRKKEAEDESEETLDGENGGQSSEEIILDELLNKEE